MGVLSFRRVAIACDVVNYVGLLTYCWSELCYQPVYGRVLFTGYTVRCE